MKENTKYTLMNLTSMLIFGSIGIFRRFIPLSSGLLAFMRGLVGALFLALFIKLRGGRLLGGADKKSFLLIALTGGLIGFNWILLFEAYNYTTVSTATLCYYMAPIIVILLSPVIFKEKLGVEKLICVLAAILGMAMVSGVFEGGMGDVNTKGILFGLGAGTLYACVIILNKLVHMDHPYRKTLIQLIFAALVLIPYLALTKGFSFPAMGAGGYIMLAVVCIVHTGFAYTMYFSSMQKLKSQTVALLSYADPISAMIFAALILGERMSIYGITGAVLIIGAAFVAGRE